MGNCIKKPADKPNVESEVDGNNCCLDIVDNCPCSSHCCYINVFKRSESDVSRGDLSRAKK